MAVNKNFVVKNGLEVNSDLLLADATNSRVGVGTSVPSYTLHVLGGIGATDLRVTGVTTLSSDLKVGAGGTGFVVVTDALGLQLRTIQWPSALRVDVVQAKLHVQHHISLRPNLDQLRPDHVGAVVHPAHVNVVLSPQPT